ncbi:hypothetical protein JI58_05130 [Marinosulfonomonas sp. PRT-SC04]|nr:hypothetical protein JI58_05130 [Marinosulfonomonas sp. PRT-SC04]
MKFEVQDQPKPYEKTGARKAVLSEDSSCTLFHGHWVIGKECDKSLGHIQRTAAPPFQGSMEAVVANSFLAERCCGATTFSGFGFDKGFEFIRCHSETIGDYSPLLSRDFRRLMLLGL